MLKKLVTALLMLGIVSATAPAVTAQAGMSCLGPLQAAAAVAQNPRLALATILQALGLGLGQVQRGQAPSLCLVNGSYVWVLWVDTGGGLNRRVVDALTGAPVPGQ